MVNDRRRYGVIVNVVDNYAHDDICNKSSPCGLIIAIFAFVFIYFFRSLTHDNAAGCENGFSFSTDFKTKRVSSRASARLACALSRPVLVFGRNGSGEQNGFSRLRCFNRTYSTACRSTAIVREISVFFFSSILTVQTNFSTASRSGFRFFTVSFFF